MSPQPVDGFLPMLAAQLVFERRQRRRDDVAMMKLGTDAFTASTHRWWIRSMSALDKIRHVRAEREPLDLLVLAQHHEPGREIRIVRRSIPGLAEQDAPGAPAS